MIVEAADRGGVPLDELIETLPLEVTKLRLRQQRVDWEHFVVMVERLDHRLGPERFDALCAQLPALAPSYRRLLGVFVSERLLYRFVNQLAGPSSYPMIHTTWTEEGRVGHLRLRLRDGLTGSRSVFRIFTAAITAMPLFINHPPATVRSQVNARGGDYWVQLPKDEGLRARLQRATQLADWDVLLETMQEDKALFLEANEAMWRRREDDFDARLAVAQVKWSLTPRQLEVLSGLARGLSNKALTAELDCSVKTVETHVTEVLRRSGSESRLALVAMFWREL
ncbi:MAG: helix-turn-helix domain-containing protein [Archangium sp.]